LRAARARSALGASVTDIETESSEGR
jgi:hypothetical protein